MASIRLRELTKLRKETREFLNRIVLHEHDALNFVREISLHDSADGAVSLHVLFYVDPEFMSDGKTIGDLQEDT